MFKNIFCTPKFIIKYTILTVGLFLFFFIIKTKRTLLLVLLYKWFFFYINNILLFLNIFDINFFFLFVLLYLIYNIINTHLFIKKALNLYIFLFFLIIAFNLFGFNSFVGFLILVELTTITFIVLLIFNFSNYFTVRFTQKQYILLLIFLVVCVFDRNYCYVFPLSLESFSYYHLFLQPTWNDFVGIYLYMFFDNSFFMIITGVVFYLVTIGFIYLFKFIFVQKIFNLTFFRVKFLKNLYKNFLSFYSKYNFWESLDEAVINKFKK